MLFRGWEYSVWPGCVWGKPWMVGRPASGGAHQGSGPLAIAELRLHAGSQGMAVKETGAPLAELMGGLPADKTVGDPWGLGGGVISLGKVRCRTFTGENLATQGEKVGVVGGRHGCGSWSGHSQGECRWGSSERAPLLASPRLLGPLGWWSAEVTRLSLWLMPCKPPLPCSFSLFLLLSSSPFSPPPLPALCGAVIGPGHGWGGLAWPLGSCSGEAEVSGRRAVVLICPGFPLGLSPEPAKGLFLCPDPRRP